MTKTAPRHVISKFLKNSDKDKILKASREKKTYYIQRNNDEDDSKFVIKNNASKTRVKKYF